MSDRSFIQLIFHWQRQRQTIMHLL
uniref:Uncharacterized protein n=1 Tax=Anguilla anguilla TaxID=7936 RepID=A0A0E9XYH3_ANGAN